MRGQEQVPYLKDDLTKLMGLWMLVPAVSAALLAGFGIRVLGNELLLFAKTKVAYHALQNTFLSQWIQDPKDRKRVEHEYPGGSERSTRFDHYTFGLTVSLLVLSICNVLFLFFRWLPHIT
jgi:hypothetical protein